MASAAIGRAQPVKDSYEPGIFSGLLPSKGFVIGLVLVTALAIGVVALVAQVSQDSGEATGAAGAESDAGGLTLSAPAGDSGEGTLSVDGDTLIVALEGLDASRSAEYYALWLVNSDTDLLPVAAFRVDETGTADFRTPLPTVLERFRRVEVTREPEDGDPARSGAVILSGPTG